MRLFGVILALTAAGCFPSDLGEGRIICGANSSCPPGYVCRPDNHCYSPSYPFNAHPDLSVRDLSGGGGAGGSGDMTGTPPTDMTGTVVGDMASLSNVCSATNLRVCTSATQSAICIDNGGSWVPMPDRTCPPGSMCAMGHCQPPANPKPCSTNSDCTSPQVCDQYVSGTVLVGYCSGAIPGSGGNNRCSAAGYDNKCTTGICASAAGSPSTRACLNPCRTSNDCMGRNCDLVGAPTTIEGGSSSNVRFCESN